MSFTIEQRERDGVPILGLNGRLVAGDPVNGLREKLLAMLETGLSSGVRAVVLDCRETSYIDSSALGLLVLAHARAMKAQGKLPIFGLNRRGLELLILTKLSTVFELYGDETSAVNSCFPDRTAKRFDILEFVQKKRAEGAAQ
ncbi:MAG: STAS domain-containing protein [Bryobacteraceae bacterium]|nr:STAS domain-containing protein [Bryobacteraceae bacterium]